MLFLKKRAALEEEYGKQMTKLAQSMAESFEKAHPRAGSVNYGLNNKLRKQTKLTMNNVDRMETHGLLFSRCMRKLGSSMLSSQRKSLKLLMTCNSYSKIPKRAGSKPRNKVYVMRDR